MRALPECERRHHYERFCSKRTTGGALKTCVFDLCAGLNKDAMRQFMRDHRHEKHKRRPHRLVKRSVCSAEGDPHFGYFSGKRGDFQGVGDFVLYKGRELEVHYRGHNYLNTKAQIQVLFGARVRGDVVITTGFDLSKLRINGHHRTIGEGKTDLPDGGYLLKAGNKLTVHANKFEEVDCVSVGFYFNTYVRSSEEHVGGVCAQQYIHGYGIFEHAEEARILNPHHRPCEHKKKDLDTSVKI